MPTLQTRLDELGITIPHRSPSPAGSYVPAVVSGDLVFTAASCRSSTGRCPSPARSAPASAHTCATTAALNALSAIAEVLGSLDRVTRIVKVVGFVASDPGFTAQPAVLNGASEVLGAIFGDAGVHARSAVGVAVLPLDSPVEVELTVAFA